LQIPIQLHIFFALVASLNVTYDVTPKELSELFVGDPEELEEEGEETEGG
jgi:hypothetical protein